MSKPLDANYYRMKKIATMEKINSKSVKTTSLLDQFIAKVPRAQWKVATFLPSLWYIGNSNLQSTFLFILCIYLEGRVTPPLQSL